MKTEQKAVLSMLIHIIEVEARGLDLSSGYGSIFDFCVRALGYSESVANRRIRAARAIRDFPAVYDHLAAGKVNICNVSKIAGIMTRENHIVLLGQISGRPTREVDMIVSSHRPAMVIRDRVTPVRVLERAEAEGGGPAAQQQNRGAGDPAGGKKFTASAGGKNPCSAAVEVRQKFRLQFAVSPGFMDKYERVKELLSTRHPGGMDLECVFEACLDEYIERHSPEARERRRARRRAKAETPAVPGEVKDTGGAVSAGQAGVQDTGEAVSGVPDEVHDTSGAMSGEDFRMGRRPGRSRHIPAEVRDRV
ncbi:MAG TPA: hypothetical protein VLA34_04555, partial [Candidatus Krumholzibacterium sp.]|nr:hypothetical protein [Candidatus Krumholzibacterium sp.]